jgi:hypothetical protein
MKIVGFYCNKDSKQLLFHFLNCYSSRLRPDSCSCNSSICVSCAKNTSYRPPTATKDQDSAMLLQTDH